MSAIFILKAVPFYYHVDYFWFKHLLFIVLGWHIIKWPVKSFVTFCLRKGAMLDEVVHVAASAGESRTRSKVVLVEIIHQALEVLLVAEEPRIVHWDGRILRIHKLSSRKGNQIMHTPDAYPGLLGVFDHRANYRDLAEPLGEIIGVQL